MTACVSPGINGGPEVNGYVNITRNDGEYFDDYDRPAPEAHKLKLWLEALELRNAEDPDDLDPIRYKLTFKQMTVFDNVTELSVYTRGDELYIAVGNELYLVENPLGLPIELTTENIALVHPNEVIDRAAVTYTKGGKTEPLSLNENESKNLGRWAESLLLEHHIFSEGDTPLDRYGDSEQYKFEFFMKRACNCDHSFSYIIVDDNSCWLKYGGSWYFVKNPETPPV